MSLHLGVGKAEGLSLLMQGGRMRVFDYNVAVLCQRAAQLEVLLSEGKVIVGSLNLSAMLLEGIVAIYLF